MRNTICWWIFWVGSLDSSICRSIRNCCRNASWCLLFSFNSLWATRKAFEHSFVVRFFCRMVGSLVASANFLRILSLLSLFRFIDSVCFHRNTIVMLFFNFGDHTNLLGLHNFFSAAVMASARVSSMRSISCCCLVSSSVVIIHNL